MSKIRSALLNLINQISPMQVIAARVESVDEDNCTCDCSPADGGPVIFNTRLRSSIDGIPDGIMPIPVVGSYVLIGLIDNNANNTYVISFSAISKITIKCDDIRLNGDGHGGLIKIQALVDKINYLENKMTNHQHTYLSPGGLADTVSNLSQVVNPVTSVGDLQNDKVKHG